MPLDRDNEPFPLRSAADWARPVPDESVAYLRPPIGGPPSQAQMHQDAFSEAVAKALQEELGPEPVEAPAILRNHRSFGLTIGYPIAAGAATFVALVFVATFPTSQGPAGEDSLSILPTLQSLKSSLLPAPRYKPASTPVISESTSEPSSLGVSVSSRSSVATATVAKPDNAIGVSAIAAVAPSSPVMPAPQRQQPPAAAAPVVAAPPPPPPVVVATVSPPPPPPQARPEPKVREINPDEVAQFVRRGEELLATGDLQAARLLLLRAAEARDARAALVLARTFDPIASKQLGLADPQPDLEQARTWYQRAQEWGSPEAKRQLDALANYGR
jgi:hypothetical protein